jgi:hypothetical protein
MLQVILNNDLSDNTEYIKFTKDLQSQSTLNLSTPDLYCSEYEYSTKLIKGSTHNNFINTFLESYNLHLPLLIRPDDIMLTLQMAFSTCVNNNAEELRHLFVSHAGKVKLEVFSDSFNTQYFCTEFKKKLTESIKDPKFAEIFTTSYSTTTPLISTVSNMLLMNTLKEYFSFNMVLGCGIPSIYMGGTQKDWIKLKDFYNYMKGFFKTTELKDWFDHMDVIMNMFIEMRLLSESGTVDATDTMKKMWSRVITYIPYGSGGDKLLGGWLRLLVPYSSSNKLFNFSKKIEFMDLNKEPIYNEKESYNDRKIMATFYMASEFNSMQKAIVETPANLNYYGNEYDVAFYSGYYAPHINSNNIVCFNIGYKMSEYVI